MTKEAFEDLRIRINKLREEIAECHGDTQKTPYVSPPHIKN